MVKVTNMTDALITIRAATDADAESMSALVATLIDRWLLPDGNPLGRTRLMSLHAPEAISANMAAGFRYWLAERSGTMLGFVALKPPSHLFNLYVHEAWHRHGVGRLLWRQLRDTVLHQQGTTITVNASQLAVPVYLGWGFRPTDRLQTVDGLSSQPMSWTRPV